MIWATLILAAVTFVLAVTTVWLALEAHRARGYEAAPILVPGMVPYFRDLDTHSVSNDEVTIKIENVGRGSALNILGKVSAFSHYSPIYGVFALAPGSNITLTLPLAFEAEDTQLASAKNMPEFEHIHLELRYEDIYGISYRSEAFAHEVIGKWFNFEYKSEGKIRLPRLRYLRMWRKQRKEWAGAAN